MIEETLRKLEPKKKMFKKIFLQSLILAFIVSGCSLENTSFDKPQVQKMLEARKSFDTQKYGFSQIQPSDQFYLQNYSGTDAYDVMLHINRKTSDFELNKSAKVVRTVAFKKTSDGYQWVGEQARYIGPNQYLNDGRKTYEAITLTYETYKRPGFPLNELDIFYFGPDKRLISRPKLDEVLPILKEWGYDP